MSASSSWRRAALIAMRWGRSGCSFTTAFPVNWTAAQVIQAVYEATYNYVIARGIPPIGRGLPADTDLGVALRLHINTNAAGVPGLICSGYPNGPQPLVTAGQAPQ